MLWHQLSDGAYSGKTLPQVMFEDPDYIFDQFEAGKFSGPLSAEAAEICRRASHIRVPREGGEEAVVVFYNLLPDHSFGGLAIVPKSDPELSEYERRSAAYTEGCFDLTVPRRIAPADSRRTLLLLESIKYHYLTDLGETSERFFEDPRFFEEADPRSAPSQSASACAASSGAPPVAA